MSTAPQAERESGRKDQRLGVFCLIEGRPVLKLRPTRRHKAARRAR
jgi:hypothetical protein